jgi:hypothetical protein
MKRIEIKLSLPAVAPLLDVIKAMADTLGDSLAAPAGLDDLDADFRAAWQAELLTAQNGDVRALLALFNKEFFTAPHVVTLDEDNAEPIARACSALRLRLRGHALAGLADEDLEGGAVEVLSLAEPVRRAFMAYVFLATLQDLILSHLDTAILGSGHA